MLAEDLSCGVFLVVQHDDADCMEEFTQRAQERIASVASRKGLDYRVVFVDVRPRESASKLRRKPETT
jgi:hypothetical protein